MPMIDGVPRLARQSCASEPPVQAAGETVAVSPHPAQAGAASASDPSAARPSSRPRLNIPISTSTNGRPGQPRALAQASAGTAAGGSDFWLTDSRYLPDLPTTYARDAVPEAKLLRFGPEQRSIGSGRRGGGKAMIGVGEGGRLTRRGVLGAAAAAGALGVLARPRLAGARTLAPSDKVNLAV